MPIRFKIEFNNFNNSTIMIKELKFTTNPTGTMEHRAQKTFHPAPTGIFSPKTTFNQLNYIIDGENVKIYNIQEGNIIDVYNANGQLVKSETAQSTSHVFQLNKGFYIVKSNNSVAKVIVK